MIPRAVHQFVSSYQAGDGIGNGVRLIQRLLHAAGVRSLIYSLDNTRTSQVHSFDHYRPDARQVLLIHHGIGNVAERALRALPDQRVLVFHNITPSAFFTPDDPIQPLLAEGWRQLADWRGWLEGAIADSAQNLRALLAAGYAPARCAAIPLLVDLARYQTRDPRTATRSLEDRAVRLLFVGRIMPHKNQSGLIETLYYLQAICHDKIMLDLVGGVTDANYAAGIKAQIRALGLEAQVKLHGKLSDAALERQFQQADCYLSLSQHEGFGMPLIEALAQRLPVVAYAPAASNVAATLGKAGLLLANADPRQAAAVIAELIAQPRLGGQLLTQAQAHLKHFAPQTLYDQLRDFLANLGLELPAAQLDSPFPPPLRYRIDGPCVGSYSLALVNRELARALEARHPGAVGLLVTEGPGDFEPDPAALRAESPLVAEQIARARAPHQADVVLRLLYPPRVSGMKGRINALGCYGWEESQLPWETVTAFNRWLHCATTMSSYVTRTLIDNGVQLPIYTLGLGADHLLRTPPDATTLPPLGSGCCLLHVSSGFPRKGLDVLLAAYGRACTSDDDVLLVIKTFPNPHQTLADDLAVWRAAHSKAPQVIMIEDELSPAALRALYQRAEVLLAPSRGEGFGLPLAEAMLHDLPVITTGYGGQTDFCRPETAWLIDYQFARAQTHMQQTDSLWVEPDVEHLAQLMREFYRQWCAGTLSAWTAPKVQAARQLIEQQFTWAAVAKRLEAHLHAPAWSPLNPPLRCGCVTTWNSACGIATYSRHLLSTLDEVLVFANSNAELIAPDTPRVLRCWRAGQEDDLHGLEQAIIAADLRLVLIEFNFSLFALTALKRLLAALQTRGIQVVMTLHSTADVIWDTGVKSLAALLPELNGCRRLLVHRPADLNQLKALDIRAPAVLFPHGVDCQLAPEPSFRLPGHLAGRRLIASYGFLLPHKGLRALIAAFALLRQQHADLHLLLLNAEYPAPDSVQEAKACAADIQALGLAADTTLITDYLPDATSLAWLKHAECVVFPYQHTQESSSAAVRWGLLSGRPVLCTPLPIFDDVATVVQWLPGSNSAAIAQALAEFLAQPVAAKHQLAQQHWREQHDWARLSLRLRGLLMGLVLNPEEPAGFGC